MPAHSLIDTADVNSVPGKGVTGTISGKHIAVGNAEMFRTLPIDPAPPLKQADALRKKGQMVMLIALDGKAAALASVSDPVRQLTPEAIQELKAAGLMIIMVTGPQCDDGPSSGRQALYRGRGPCPVGQESRSRQVVSAARRGCRHGRGDAIFVKDGNT